MSGGRLLHADEKAESKYSYRAHFLSANAKREKSARQPSASNRSTLSASLSPSIFVIFISLSSPSDCTHARDIHGWLCRKVAERDGARIWTESESGKETTFRFSIPALRVEQSQVL